MCITLLFYIVSPSWVGLALCLPCCPSKADEGLISSEIIDSGRDCFVQTAFNNAFIPVLKKKKKKDLETGPCDANENVKKLLIPPLFQRILKITCDVCDQASGRTCIRNCIRNAL